MSRRNRTHVLYDETTNTIMLSGEIEFDSGTDELKLLLMNIESDMLKKNKIKPIKLYINSPGGSYFGGMSICDVIMNLKIPVHTYALGYCASAAFKIFIAGHKRFVYKHSRLMFHSISSGASGYKMFMKNELAELEDMSNQIVEYVKSRTNIPESRLRDAVDNGKDLLLNAEDAISYGVADVLVQ